jgi:hypothetical protein
VIGYAIVWAIVSVIIKALYAAMDSSIGWVAAILLGLLITLGIGGVFFTIGASGDGE